jgi:hypothetical protein
VARPVPASRRSSGTRLWGVSSALRSLLAPASHDHELLTQTFRQAANAQRVYVAPDQGRLENPLDVRRVAGDDGDGDDASTS